MSAQPVPPAAAPEPPLVRVSEGREVLAYVPHALGFTPETSLVAVSLRPPRGRIGLVARVDLDDLTGPQGRSVAHGLARHLDDDGAAGLFVVVYVPGSLARARHLAAVRRAVDALEAAADVPVRDAFVVAQDGYASLRCRDERCCPARGRPLSDLTATQIGAAMIMAGSAPVARREDLRIGVSQDAAARAAFDRAVRAERVRRVRARGTAREPGWRRDRARTCLEVLDAGTGPDRGPSPEELGRLSEALSDLLLRDLVVAAVLTGHRPDLSGASTTHRVRDDLEEAVGRMFDPGGPPPDRDRTDAARAVVAAAARLASDRPRARLLGVLAWISWWCGDGAQAQVMTRDALALDDSERLALLTSAALERGVAPAWVGGRPQPRR
ncbi:DUF4192 domain-containing protein [Litorihabitans aurantiacus]|uniref:DUF4192 domain-containing protein n=1 Tax=Litorihabitans aurantiacus TaxID=1930061 RepID=A0AA37XE06_9MICO|nr:DUF4192 domain-containing protein [Litorihabitans aurantiacus]GMA31469.1 hypothetical protein GCM10025875_14610 [Litorihabitans aurantiacus]